MCKFYFFTILFFSFIHFGSAQQIPLFEKDVNLSTPTVPTLKGTRKINSNDSTSFCKKLTFGGDFGWNFGQQEIFLNVSPLVGYKFSDKLNAGVGIICQYSQQQLLVVDAKGINYKYEASNFLYGGKLFGRFFIWKGFFANLETELINSPSNTKKIADTDNIPRNWVPVIWAGCGYKFKIVNNFGINVLAVYNPIFNSEKTPYRTPYDIRLGFQM